MPATSGGYPMLKKLLITAAMLAIALQAQGQDISDPQLLEVYVKFREMGPNLNPEVINGTGALYAEIHKTTAKGDLEVTRDVAYGPDAKNVMDVYRPRGASGTRPAVVFIHGGGLTGG